VSAAVPVVASQDDAGPAQVADEARGSGEPHDADETPRSAQPAEAAQVDAADAPAADAAPTDAAPAATATDEGASQDEPTPASH
jgi:hypothetical protein